MRGRSVPRPASSVCAAAVHTAGPHHLCVENHHLGRLQQRCQRCRRVSIAPEYTRSRPQGRRLSLLHYFSSGHGEPHYSSQGAACCLLLVVVAGRVCPRLRDHVAPAVHAALLLSHCARPPPARCGEAPQVSMVARGEAPAPNKAAIQNGSEFQASDEVMCLGLWPNPATGVRWAASGARAGAPPRTPSTTPYRRRLRCLQVEMMPVIHKVLPLALNVMCTPTRLPLAIRRRRRHAQACSSARSLSSPGCRCRWSPAP